MLGFLFINGIILPLFVSGTIRAIPFYLRRFPSSSRTFFLTSTSPPCESERVCNYKVESRRFPGFFQDFGGDPINQTRFRW